MRLLGAAVALSLASSVAHAQPSATPPDPRAACLAERAQRQRAALAIADIEERTRQLQALPDCGPPPAPPRPVEPTPTGTPPLSRRRIAKEVGYALLTEAIGFAVFAALPCDGFLCGDGPVENGVVGIFVGAALVPIPIGVVGNAGNQNGSIVLLLAGTYAGILLASGVSRASGYEAPTSIAAFATLPIAGGVLGFNLWRDYDEPDVQVAPTITRDAHGGTTLGLAGSF